MAIEFQVNKNGILAAKSGKWGFQINENGSYYWVVAVRSDKDKPAYLNTEGHQHFDSAGEAAEFCAELADGRLNLEQIKRDYELRDAAREQAEIREAVRRAKAFRDKLEAAGITYATLLDLERFQDTVGPLANSFLAGYERGEGWPE